MMRGSRRGVSKSLPKLGGPRAQRAAATCVPAHCPSAPAYALPRSAAGRGAAESVAEAPATGDGVHAELLASPGPLIGLVAESISRAATAAAVRRQRQHHARSPLVEGLSRAASAPTSPPRAAASPGPDDVDPRGLARFLNGLPVEALSREERRRMNNVLPATRVVRFAVA